MIELRGIDAGPVPGIALRGMRGMMGDMARSVSSSLGSRRQGKRAMASPRALSGDEAWTMLSEASSSSLSILRGETPQALY